MGPIQTSNLLYKYGYLKIYLGSFLWHRYCKQRNLDMFIHILSCFSEKRPFVKSDLPIAKMTPIATGSISHTCNGENKENAKNLLEDDDFES